MYQCSQQFAELAQHKSAKAYMRVPMIQVSLHRSDALSALLELDKHLAITQADAAAGLMFGCNGQQLVSLPFARWVLIVVGKLQTARCAALLACIANVYREPIRVH
jgi:hypothetical protein